MMKKILMTLTAAVAVATLSGCDDGSMFDPHTKTVRADSVVRLSATGNDLRIYEFTPQTMPDHQCIFVSGERKGGLVCLPKSEVNHAQ